ncbi:piggyBac transposable element-derived protein 4-like, partial [Sitodiplosis mosellana]|uniref:piggyBac transposable element-derived protein 4-like n=1 Tax=Sitodiplosis mosellana TaxID=263140 RepID=UPI00244503E6
MASWLVEDISSDEGDDLSDYEPEDSYDSADSDAEFLNEEERSEMQVDDNVALMSKDKTIRYSLEPPPTARPPASRVGVIANEGPMTYASARVTDLLASFLMFIEPIEKIVVDMTNLYGFRRYKDEWQNVDICTMRAYYGLLLLAGVYRSRGEDITELWDDHKGRPIFRATMSLELFKRINQCIRFDNKEERMQTNERYKLEPIRNVFEKWVQRVRDLYVPGKFVTFDEQLLPYRGRCPFIQYIPNKPAKYGIKIWVLCDSKTYYAYNLKVYVGRNRNSAPEVNQAENVVMRLAEGLNGRNLTADNWFITYSLAKRLKGQVIDESDKKKPEIIKFYNATKGAVDTLDEMVGTYRCKRRVLRWPLALFENMLDISACNALAIFLANNSYWQHAEKKARRRFSLIEVGEALVTPFISEREHMPQGKRAQNVVCDIQGVAREPSPALSKSSGGSARASPVPWLSNLRHTEAAKKRARWMPHLPLCYECK